ncbi:hypothetical protein JYT97_01820 [Haliea sp. AH-315-K21]|uniref:Metallo-beta-lactamase domain-containing protein n=1 Tax=SAR86 cluster bacterium TaxID=2030880 RepID=A0A2A5C8U9_9GAMM|nr:hypothetical protein [Haliea sp. AH-315-K21]PCJ40005.1 MAG: hypothetical protein COA71_12615 [SAR86 cluster bacterium]
MIKRRTLVKGAIGSIIVLGQSFPVYSQSRISSLQLSPGLYLIQGAGSNVVFADLADELVVIDGGLRENASSLLDEIHMLAPGKRISRLFNTNWRPEHCGLNYDLGGLGGDSATIIAHENTRLWQSADPYVEWENKQYQPMPLNAQANRGFYTASSLQLGLETLLFERLPKAHTDGDIYLYFKEADVLVVSDLLAVNSFPVIDYSTGGWLRGLRDATEALLNIATDETQIIAAQGSILTRAALLQQYVMLESAWEAVVSAFQNGLSLTEFQQTNPMRAYIAERGDPTLFLQQAYRSAWYHITERTIPNVI